MRSIATIIGFLQLIAIPIIAHADAVYTYTGAPFTEVYGQYTLEENLTGTLTFAIPLAPNLHPASLYTTNMTPVAFSFSDGVKTITQDDLNGEINTFSFATDSTGKLTAYYVAIGYFVSPFCSETVAFFLNVPNIPTVGGSDGSYCTISQPFDGGLGVSREPGVLEPITATPEPSGLALFGTGLLGTIGLVRKRIS